MTKDQRKLLNKLFRAAIKKYKRLPNDREIGKYMKCNRTVARGYIETYLKEKRVLKIGNRFIYTGIPLKRTEKRQRTKTKKVKGLDPVSAWVLSTGLVLVGIGATLMSIYHSEYFMTNNYLEGSLQLFIGPRTFVLFEVVGFDAGLFMLAIRKYFFGGALLFVSLIAFLFSVWSTIGGMYRDNADKLAISSRTSENRLNSESYTNILNDTQNAKIDVLRANIEKSETLWIEYKRTRDVNSPGSEPYNVANWWMTVEREKIDAWSEELLKLLDAKQTIGEETKRVMDETEIVAPSFEKWVGGEVFPDFDSNIFQFLLSVLPALFYDISAPLSFAVVFIGIRPWEKRKREDEENDVV